MTIGPSRTCVLSGALEPDELKNLVAAISTDTSSTNCPEKMTATAPAPAPAPATDAAPAPAPTPQQSSSSHALVSPGAVELQDLAATLHFALKHTVFTSSDTLSGARLNTVVTWLRQAADLPTAVSGASLSSLAGTLEQHQEWSSSAFAHQVQGLKAWGFGHHAGFKACKGEGHGYACGLWQLFHSLVQATKDDLATLHTIQAVVADFFPCTSCQQHFAKASVAVGSAVPAEGAALWLWSAHNEVSKRLAPVWGRTEEEVRYPPASACPACHQGAEFDKSEVAKYLAQVYGMQNRPQVLSEDASHVIPESDDPYTWMSGGGH